MPELLGRRNNSALPGIDRLAIVSHARVFLRCLLCFGQVRRRPFGSSLPAVYFLYPETRGVPLEEMDK